MQKENQEKQHVTPYQFLIPETKSKLSQVPMFLRLTKLSEGNCSILFSHILQILEVCIKYKLAKSRNLLLHIEG